MISLRSTCLLAIIGPLLAGCGVRNTTIESQHSIEREDVRRIVEGVSTRSDVLRLLGPPQAVARQGKTVRLPATATQSSREVDADTLFELFSADHELTAEHIIYYYDSSRFESSGGFVLGLASSTTSTVNDRLWLLIDTADGIVDDLVYRSSE
jgi:hypothetical protein